MRLIIAFLLPSFNFMYQSFAVSDALIQALAIENTQFNFGHNKPTAMFRRVMKFDFIQNSFRFNQLKGFVQSTCDVGIQISMTS